MPERFAGRVALVTGGTRGLGGATVERLIEEGATVVTCARMEPREPLPGGVTFLVADVTDEDSVSSVVEETVRLHGHLDIVVANVGTAGLDQWPEVPTKDWNDIIQLNLNGTMFTCRAAWPHLVKSAGCIVVVSSLSSVMGIGSRQLEQMGGFQPSPSYQVSKAALEGFVRHLAGRGGEHNVRVNAVRPGRIMTRYYEELLGEDGLFWSHYEQIQLLKRQGRAEDVAGAIAFLASEDADFITGTILEVDGGAVAKL